MFVLVSEGNMTRNSRSMMIWAESDTNGAGWQVFTFFFSFFVNKIDQSQITHGKIVSEGKLPLMAK